MSAADDGDRSPDRIPFLVLASGVALTLVVVWLLAATAEDRDRHEFEAASAQAQAAILAKVETSVALLRGAAGFFASQERPNTVERFGAYVERLALRERYPGLLGIGYARRVKPGEAETVTAEIRRQGREGFRIWPQQEGERTTIEFLEPLDARNRAAIGYDMSTNAVRREAMERARDNGSAHASGAVVLVQEIEAEKQPGFLIYIPVYDSHIVPPTVAERRAQLRGFAYSPIRAVDFLSSAFAHESTPSVGFAVYHGSQAAGGALLYQRGINGRAPRFRMTRTVDVVGQPWTFAFQSRTTFAESLVLPAAVLLAGLALSALASVLVRRERGARAQAQHALGAERAARAEAERANRAKDEFFTTLSHELRTPLHAIIGWTSLLRHPSLNDEQRRVGIDVVERNALAQSRLIEDLLDMSRIASGKVTLEMQPVDPAAVIAESLKSLGPSAVAKGIALHTQLPDQGLSVRGDPARLRQVVTNLLSNAIKFTPAGGRIDVTLLRHDGMARFCVADTGQGIDPAFIAHMFDRFTQADASASRQHGGLGLGLAIVRELVSLHGGTVRAKSDGHGRGATFIVDLPLMEAPAAAGEDAAEREPDAHSLRGIKVLAVDDDADSRELLRAVLTRRGAEVLAVGSANEALEALRAAPPDVLLSDIGMPGMDGYALLRRVRELPPEQGGNIPAAAISAYAREADREAALRAGFDTHLVKPLRGDALVDIVASLGRTRGAFP